MKSFFKNTITAIMVAAMLLLSPTIHAASVQATASGVTSLLTSGASIYKITVVNSDLTNTVTLKLYDAPSTLTNYTTAAYTNTTVATATVITSYTDILGITEYRTNLVSYRTNAVVAAATNNTYRLLATVVVPLNSTQVITPAVPLNALQGILAYQSNSNLTTTIDYAPIR